MKYEWDDSFLADYARLSTGERTLFRAAVREINEAYARASTWPSHWPAHLRIKTVRGVPRVWEMTWSFAGPDGRATFEFVTIDGEPGILWRRIGGHEIFRNP